MEPELTAAELVVKRIENLCKQKNRIKNRKITPYRISKNGNLNPRTLNNILSGKRKDTRITTIEKICLGLDMSIKDFFDDDLFI